MTDDPPMLFVGKAMETWLQLSAQDKARLTEWVQRPHLHHARTARLEDLTQALRLGPGALRVFTSVTGIRHGGIGGFMG